MWSEDGRKKRRWRTSIVPGGRAVTEFRTPWQKDCDRVFYSSALKRLNGVSQVVCADPTGFFHNRYIHTMKVAQIGKRLAQYQLRKNPTLSERLMIDPDVVEAACYIHDLGHPPFGHVGEKVLNKVVGKRTGSEGYEGNAQSFRIVTTLALRDKRRPGLDLTAATLAASLKYPWAYDSGDAYRSKKWGFYASEEDQFNFAREWIPKPLRHIKTAEAELMDWADDITYSVHDIEDFHRSRSIPWHLFNFDDDESSEYRERLVQNALEAWINPPTDSEGRLRSALDAIVELLKQDRYSPIMREPYEGTPNQRIALRTLSSVLIDQFTNAITLVDPDKEGTAAKFDPELVDQVRILKQVTRQFIHENLSLGAQQKGQRLIIENLFDDFEDDISEYFKAPKSYRLAYVPKRFHYLIESYKPAGAGKVDDSVKLRLVADCISGLSDIEAISLHNRLKGIELGSIRDPIVA
jgi:dGTPase